MNCESISKKSDSENHCQNAECKQKTTSEKGKFYSNKTLGLDLTMNGLEKNQLKKKPIHKKEKKTV